MSEKGKVVSIFPNVHPCFDIARALFDHAVLLESDPRSWPEAVQAYQRYLEVVPNNADANINLGTIFYNLKMFKEAEHYYRRAIQICPTCALAYFDLGNILDETGRNSEAIGAYTLAIGLEPMYADAHYNLALALQKSGMRIKALKHWRIYAKLDKVGAFHNQAKKQIRKIVEDSGLCLVYERRWWRF